LVDTTRPILLLIDTVAYNCISRILYIVRARDFQACKMKTTFKQWSLLFVFLNVYISIVSATESLSATVTRTGLVIRMSKLQYLLTSNNDNYSNYKKYFAYILSILYVINR